MGDVFVAVRVTMARAMRGMTGTALARSAHVTPEWISKVERSRTTPGAELVERLAKALDLPLGFFYREPVNLPPSEAFYFRASSKLARKDEAAAQSIATIATELSEWMDTAYRLPTPGVPEIQDLSGSDIAVGPEVTAESLRSYWGLGAAAITNMVALLESRGVRIFSVSSRYQAIDAFSFRHGNCAIVFLNPSKSAERLRFDLAHELGHLLMHGGSLHGDDSKTRERQANDFASAFLMPRRGVLGNLRRNASVDTALSLRDTWKVSAMAATMRLHQLGIISDWTYRTMCQELSKRGFRRGEPGSTLQPESSSLWAQILADLREQNLGFPYLSGLVDVRPSDIRSLLVGLVPVTVDGDGRTSPNRHASASRLHLVSG